MISELRAFQTYEHPRFPTLVESFLRDTIGFQARINEFYKYFKCIINSDTCTLSNDSILAELKAKEILKLLRNLYYTSTIL